MNFRKLACVLAVSCAGLIGCGDDDDSGDAAIGADGSGDGGGDNCTTGNDGFFVVSKLEYGSTDTMMRTPGFNLDGKNSVRDGMDGCGIMDAMGDPTRGDAEGVDNQLGPTLGGLVTQVPALDVGGQVRSGNLLILVNLENVDNYTNDPCVTVSLLLGLLPEGTTMPMAGTNGALTAGQTFDVNSISFNGTMPKINAQGSITNGVLSVGPVDLMLSLPTDNGDAPLNIYDAQLEMAVTQSGFSNGVLGGALIKAELIAAVRMINPMFESLANSVLIPDLNDPTCDRISISLTFEGATAVQGTTRAAPAPTM